MKHPIDWRAPAPLWDLALADGGTHTRFQQPALLRFDSESFMQDIRDGLANDPEQLADYVARPEQWESPVAGWVIAGDDSLAKVLKLFQPAQSRFYLVAASLICERTGLPERKVDLAAEERAGFVVRRLVPHGDLPFDPNDAATFAEHVWIGNRENGQWQVAAAAGQLADGEEVLPLFPLAFDYEGKKRQLHVGTVPVAGREVYETRSPTTVEAAPLVSEDGDPLIALEDPRKAVWADGPGLALALYADTKDIDASGDGQEMSDDDARELLRFTLLDIVDFLQQELPQLWNAIDAESNAELQPSAVAAYDALAATIPHGVSWREALRRTDDRREVLLRDAEPAPGSEPAVPDTVTRADVANAANDLLVNVGFGDLLFAFLDDVEPSATSVPGGAPTASAEAAAKADSDGAFYAVRCVYQQPRCGVFVRPVVSALSRPFRLAAFFDPDAPVRPVTIRMPIDVSIRGLSRFPKGVSMVMSEKLRQKVEHLQNSKLAEIDDGELSEPPPAWGIGMICSLSIPIITLCAMIVLMIFIQLLNIVFWWLPFLRICLPIPVRKN